MSAPDISDGTADQQIASYVDRILRLREEAGDLTESRRRDGGRRTPPGVIDAAMGMLLAGATVTQTAEACGVALALISRTAKRRGLAYAASNDARRVLIAERQKATQAYIAGVKVTPEEAWLRAAFDYDPATGSLVWRRRDDVPASWNTRYADTPAGTAHSAGYVSVRIFKRAFLAHRLIWKWTHGYDAAFIDHINGDRRDNRSSNLRDVTHQQNCWNTTARNKLGLKGVRETRSGTFEARLLRKHIGNFASAEEASAAFLAAATAARGEFEGAAR